MQTSILIVEDQGLIALDLKKKLEQTGYTVVGIVDNAADAILYTERLKPCLVLMDIRLRGSPDGIEAADQIRQRFHAPVMFLTAHTDAETLDRARITEPFGYIVKPFQSSDFRARIEIALWKHKMEQKLRSSEAWLSATFRNVADALIATDGAGHIALMNGPASVLTGWEAEEAKGKPLLEVFQSSDEITGAGVDVSAVHAGSTGLRTLRLRKRNGPDSGTTFTVVEAEFSANRDEGTVLGLIVVFRDVTARRSAEERDRQLQKTNALNLMAIGLGRDLAESQRQVDSLLTQAIALSRGSSLRLLGDVYARSAYQQSVVQQLIRIGTVDAGQATILDLNAVLREVEADFRKALGKGRSLTMKLQPDLPRVSMDARGLRESVLRLVADARHAMPDGGALEISTSDLEAGDTAFGVGLQIRDTGKGIRPEARERVFDPYYQSRPGKRNPGFSLALVYKFVTMSGGHIEVESEPGQGTAYRLRFPAMREDAQGLPLRPGARAASA